MKKNGAAGEPPNRPDPADPADPRHGAWRTTPGTLAPEVRMTVVLNKLPQIKSNLRYFLLLAKRQPLLLPTLGGQIGDHAGNH